MTDEPIVIKEQAFGPGMANGPSTKKVDTWDVVWVTGVGCELPSQELQGIHHYVRDGAGGIGIMLQIEGLENIKFLGGLPVKTSYKLVMNPTTIGRTIALLHEFAILIGAEKEMHAELDKTRTEVREIMAGIDLSAYV